jgi:hypothetical protein
MLVQDTLNSGQHRVANELPTLTRTESASVGVEGMIVMVARAVEASAPSAVIRSRIASVRPPAGTAGRGRGLARNESWMPTRRIRLVEDSISLRA